MALARRAEALQQHLRSAPALEEGHHLLDPRERALPLTLHPRELLRRQSVQILWQGVHLVDLPALFPPHLGQTLVLQGEERTLELVALQPALPRRGLHVHVGPGPPRNAVVAEGCPSRALVEKLGDRAWVGADRLHAVPAELRRESADVLVIVLHESEKPIDYLIIQAVVFRKLAVGDLVARPGAERVGPWASCKEVLQDLLHLLKGVRGVVASKLLE